MQARSIPVSPDVSELEGTEEIQPWLLMRWEVLVRYKLRMMGVPLFPVVLIFMEIMCL